MLTAERSTVSAGLSSKRAPRRAETRTGAPHGASGPALLATKRRGWPIWHGAERTKEKYCRPLRSMPTPGSAAHDSSARFGAEDTVVVCHVAPPSVDPYARIVPYERLFE